MKATTYFETVQHIMSYIFGFITGITLLNLQIAALFLVWFAIQTFLAFKIFKFGSPMYGLSFAGIDTLTDIGIGVLSGSGTMAFTLLRMASMSSL